MSVNLRRVVLNSAIVLGVLSFSTIPTIFIISDVAMVRNAIHPAQSWTAADSISWGISAAGVGAIVAALVESRKPYRWALVSAIVYMWYFVWPEVPWSMSPELSGGVLDVAGRVVPSLACAAAGYAVSRRRASNNLFAAANGGAGSVRL